MVGATWQRGLLLGAAAAASRCRTLCLHPCSGRRLWSRAPALHVQGMRVRADGPQLISELIRKELGLDCR